MLYYPNDHGGGALTAEIDFAARDAEEINLREAILASEGIPRRPHVPQPVAKRRGRARL